MWQPDLARLRRAIIEVFPDLSEARLTLLTGGWDCLAVDADDRMIFKFPRHEAAQASLEREARLLEVVGPAVDLKVPELALHRAPDLFSSHEKLPGGHLLAEQYAKLPGDARDRLADDMAGFFAQLHLLDMARLRDAGAMAIRPWLSSEEILRRALPVLPEGLTDIARRTISAYRLLPPDPHGEVYGFFDGHGWNMAFDHATGRLNGIYDFADSGCGPVHQEFIYPGLVSGDLVGRIIGAYEGFTGLSLDHERIHVLAGAHRLSELAEYAEDEHHLPVMVASFAAWAARGPCF